MAKRWDRTGTVIEDKGLNKYSIRIDGSGRVTDRNRQFLRGFKPATNSTFNGPTPQSDISSQVRDDHDEQVQLPVDANSHGHGHDVGDVPVDVNRGAPLCDKPPTTPD